MPLNWQLLLGLLMPAYGFGYIWLIKTAREDRLLYAEVEKHLKLLLVLFQIALIVTSILGIYVAEIPKPMKTDLGSLTALLLILTNVVQQSFPFFRRIAALPPKTSGAVEPGAPHTEDPMRAPE